MTLNRFLDTWQPVAWASRPGAVSIIAQGLPVAENKIERAIHRTFVQATRIGVVTNPAVVEAAYHARAAARLAAQPTATRN